MSRELATARAMTSHAVAASLEDRPRDTVLMSPSVAWHGHIAVAEDQLACHPSTPVLRTCAQDDRRVGSLDSDAPPAEWCAYGTRLDQIESGKRSIIRSQTSIDASRLRPCRKYSVMPSQ